MNKELLIKRLIELIRECDEWLKLEVPDKLKYYLDINPGGIIAEFDEVEIKDETPTFNYRTRFLTTKTIRLPLINKVGLKVLLGELHKTITHTPEIDITLKDKFRNSKIKVWFNDKQGFDIQVIFDSPIDRIKGLGGRTIKGNRFINSNIQS